MSCKLFALIILTCGSSWGALEGVYLHKTGIQGTDLSSHSSFLSGWVYLTVLSAA